jgi:hypothetical protein
MKSGRGFFVIAILLIAAVMVFSCFLRSAEAGPRGGRAVQGPRSGDAGDGLKGNVADEGPRGNVAVGTRYTVLPPSAKAVIFNNRTYYVDDTYVYYLPCDDDTTVYCVVLPPE